MEHMEILMQPIDTITVEEVRNVHQLHANAEAISGMLLAVPHLFPPTTNLYDPKVQQPVTLALPTIWKDFNSLLQYLLLPPSRRRKRWKLQKGKRRYARRA